MKLTILCIGRIKEKDAAGLIAEYQKRLKPYCSFHIIELKDEKVPKTLSPAQIRQAVEREGERLLSYMAGCTNVTLEIDARQMSSTQFADYINEKALTGRDLNFIIGGSNGLSDAVKAQSDLALSFSKMTFPHQLFRIMLIEQIYRAFKINRNETYHK